MKRHLICSYFPFGLRGTLTSRNDSLNMLIQEFPTGLISRKKKKQIITNNNILFVVAVCNIFHNNFIETFACANRDWIPCNIFARLCDAFSRILFIISFVFVWFCWLRFVIEWDRFGCSCKRYGHVGICNYFFKWWSVKIGTAQHQLTINIWFVFMIGFAHFVTGSWIIPVKLFKTVSNCTWSHNKLMFTNHKVEVIQCAKISM